MNKTEAREMFDLGKTQAKIQLVDGMPCIVVPDGYKVQELGGMLNTPLRVKECRVFTTIESFLDYVAEFRYGNTHIFCDPNKMTFTAIFDYHGKDKPAWCDHGAKFSPPVSDEWESWANMNNTKMPQSGFLEFLEDHIANIIAPAGADILEMCSSLEGMKNVNFKSGFKQKDGAVCIKWEENFEANATKAGNLNIPSELELAIAPFKRGQVYKVRAYLRYRIVDGKLSFLYKLIDPDKVIGDAVDGFISTVNERTGLPPLISVL